MDDLEFLPLVRGLLLVFCTNVSVIFFIQRAVGQFS